MKNEWRWRKSFFVFRKKIHSFGKNKAISMTRKKKREKKTKSFESYKHHFSLGLHTTIFFLYKTSNFFLHHASILGRHIFFCWMGRKKNTHLLESFLSEERLDQKGAEIENDILFSFFLPSRKVNTINNIGIINHFNIVLNRYVLYMEKIIFRLAFFSVCWLVCCFFVLGQAYVRIVGRYFTSSFSFRRRFSGQHCILFFIATRRRDVAVFHPPKIKTIDFFNFVGHERPGWRRQYFVSFRHVTNRTLVTMSHRILINDKVGLLVKSKIILFNWSWIQCWVISHGWKKSFRFFTSNCSIFSKGLFLVHCRWYGKRKKNK